MTKIFCNVQSAMNKLVPAIGCGLLLAQVVEAQDVVLPQNRSAFYADERIETAVTDLAPGATAVVELSPKQVARRLAHDSGSFSSRSGREAEQGLDEGTRLRVHSGKGSIGTHVLLAFLPEQFVRVQFRAGGGEPCQLDAKCFRFGLRDLGRMAAGLIHDHADGPTFVASTDLVKEGPEVLTSVPTPDAEEAFAGPGIQHAKDAAAGVVTLGRSRKLAGRQRSHRD